MLFIASLIRCITIFFSIHCGFFTHGICVHDIFRTADEFIFIVVSLVCVYMLLYFMVDWIFLFCHSYTQIQQKNHKNLPPIVAEQMKLSTWIFNTLHTNFVHVELAIDLIVKFKCACVCVCGANAFPMWMWFRIKSHWFIFITFLLDNINRMHWVC